MIPIIFCHYGNSPYLKYSLKSAQISNPNKKKILIGDKTNLKVALENGWDHYFIKDFISEKREKFNNIFYWIQGKDHNPLKGGEDWLRFVFDRFFVLEALVIDKKIDDFWHFDSDTMIVKNLNRFEKDIRFSNFDVTTLCNGTCQAGYMNAKVLKDFTQNIIDDYSDKEYLDSLNKEFSSKHSLAYTEMRSFSRFIKRSNFCSMLLSSLFIKDGVWFDDCICQDQGFKLFYYPKLSTGLKNLYIKDKNFCCKKENNKEYQFATINCSWVDYFVFEWIINNLNQSAAISPRLEEYLLTDNKSNIKIIFINFIKRLIWKFKIKKSKYKNKIKKIFFKNYNENL